MKRPYWALLAPTALGILIAVLPLILGSHTLFLRDVFSLHLPLKANQAHALEAGEIPQVDLFRGGEPMTGNANGLPFYPGNLLYLAGDFFWVFNAHFWIHWLLGLLAFAFMARAFGLSREGAAAAAVFWATGAYFLSQLGYYNLVAVVALAPAFAGCWIGAAEYRRLWPLSAFVLAAMLLAGDPFSVLLALLAAVAGMLFRPAPIPWRGMVLSGLGGALLAAPGLVELARVVPTSLRALTSQSAELGQIGSFSPAILLEILFPWLLGSHEDGYFIDPAPFYGTIFPGILALAAALLAARRGALASWQTRWALTLLAGGILLALGGYNPVVRLLYEHLPGFSQLRFPAKFSLLWAMGLALLGGLGFERFVAEAKAQRRLTLILGGFAVFYLLALLGLPFLPGGSWPASLGLGSIPSELFPGEKVRWAGILATLAGSSLVLWLASLLSRRSVAIAATLLLAASSAMQLDLLGQLFWSDETGRYREPPAALAVIPADALSFHRTITGVSAGSPLLSESPEPPSKRVVRCGFSGFSPLVGAFWQRRFVLAQTADFLDSRDGYLLAMALHAASDREALRVARALGAERWLAAREIEPAAAAAVELLGRFPTDCGGELFVYRLADPLPGSFVMVGNVRRANRHESGGFRSLASGETDAATTAILFGDGEAASGRPNGTLRVIEEDSDSFTVEADSPLGGVLVARRQWLPLYRAFVDGEETPTAVANLLQLGVELPAGRHLVRVEADRRPLEAAFAVSGLAAAVLLVAFFRLPATKKGGSADPPLSAG